jgi:hypothetical protein
MFKGNATMASPHPSHERRDPVSDTVGHFFSRYPAPRRGYAFCPLAASLDSMVRKAS